MTTNQTPEQAACCFCGSDNLWRYGADNPLHCQNCDRYQDEAANQTPEQQIDDVRRTRLEASGAIIALVEAQHVGCKNCEDIEEKKRLTAAVAEAITAYGDARYAAGRRDMRAEAEKIATDFDHVYTTLWLRGHYDSLATPTETKPTEAST